MRQGQFAVAGGVGLDQPQAFAFSLNPRIQQPSLGHRESVAGRQVQQMTVMVEHLHRNIVPSATGQTSVNHQGRKANLRPS